MEQKVELAVDLTLEFLDASGTVIYCEPTVTEFITSKGAKVLTHSRIPVGEFLVVKTLDGQFSSPAIVKASEIGVDSIPRILVEFTNTDLRGWMLNDTKPTLKTQYKELLQRSQEAFLLLNIVISELEQNNPPDPIFLDELKSSVDILRTVIFRTQKMQNENLL